MTNNSRLTDRSVSQFGVLCRCVLTLTCLVGLSACSPSSDEAADTEGTAEVTASKPESLDPIATAYVRLVLAVGQHDAGYVDAYYGPEELRPDPQGEAVPLAELRQQGDQLRQDLAALHFKDAMLVLRHRYLDRQLESVVGYLDHLDGQRHRFDEESKLLYDAVAPTHDEATFQGLLDGIEDVLAEQGYNEGSLNARYQAFRQDFVIPDDKLDAVFRAAIDACRQRAAEHLDLPPNENFVVEYVEDKSWSGYNWYQGQHQSLIQVNTDFPIFIDRAVDLACHEGYPGHHLYNSLLEKHLMRDRGWLEVSVYPLFSPQSLIAEGSANYGIEMAFPGDERVAYETQELFPLAGLDASRAEAYYRVQEQVAKLSYAGNEAARRYLDGEIDGEAAVEWLVRYSMMEEERARQRLSFIDTYRSYVINYNLGKDLVADWVEAQAGDDPEKRWEVFGRLLSSPLLPSDLQ